MVVFGHFRSSGRVKEGTQVLNFQGGSLLTNGPRRTQTRDLVLLIVGLVSAECKFLRMRRKFLRADPRGQITKQGSTAEIGSSDGKRGQQRVREVDFGGGT